MGLTLDNDDWNLAQPNSVLVKFMGEDMDADTSSDEGPIQQSRTVWKYLYLPEKPSSSIINLSHH